jgi:hypothetical protein
MLGLGSQPSTTNDDVDKRLRICRLTATMLLTACRDIETLLYCTVTHRTTGRLNVNQLHGCGA